MTGKELKDTLKNGGRVYGTLIVSTSPIWLEVIENLGLDFVFIDTEHIPIDRHQLSWMCHAYLGKSIAPIVRIPLPDPYEACKALDGGAKGIVAPYIETAEEVRQLSGAVKNRPLKGQKLQDFLSGEKSMEPKLKEYLQSNNEENVLIVNIESYPAIENLDEILATPGLDVVLIGPHDLSCNLGIPEQYDNPVFLDAVKNIISKARKANVGAGIHAFYEGALEKEIEWAKMGVNFLIHSGDINRFTQGMRRDIKKLRSELGDVIIQSASEINI